MRLEDKNITTTHKEYLSTMKPNFVKADFDAAVENHGYDVIWERALKCPCKGRNTEFLSNCKNCGSTGWIFINPTETRMVVQSMSLNPKFESWGMYGAEISSITANSRDKLSYMDKITVQRALAEHSEVLHVVNDYDSLYAYTVFPIKEIFYVGLFAGANNKLQRLEKDKDFTVQNENKIILDPSFLDSFNGDMSFTIRYIHNPVYHVIEMVRDSIAVQIKNGRSSSTVQMPINARAQRANVIKDKENYTGDRLIDNSFKIC